MKRIKFRLPLSLTAAMLMTAIAADQAAAQTTAPVVPNVPQEEAYEMRALPPQEAAQEASAEEGPNQIGRAHV